MPSDSPISVTVDEVPAEMTYALRAAVLRPDGGEITWAGDEDPDTFHLGARRGGQLVGVVRFSQAPCPWRTATAPWQLRGMATDATVRGSGVGRALVAGGLARVARTGATVNVFALDPDPGLVHFVHDLTQRAGGRVFQPDAERLGEYVVADYLRTRRGRRRH